MCVQRCRMCWDLSGSTCTCFEVKTGWNEVFSPYCTALWRFSRFWRPHCDLIPPVPAHSAHISLSSLSVDRIVFAFKGCCASLIEVEGTLTPCVLGKPWNKHFWHPIFWEVQEEVLKGPNIEFQWNRVLFDPHCAALCKSWNISAQFRCQCIIDLHLVFDTNFMHFYANRKIFYQNGAVCAGGFRFCTDLHKYLHLTCHRWYLWRLVRIRVLQCPVRPAIAFFRTISIEIAFLCAILRLKFDVYVRYLWSRSVICDPISVICAPHTHTLHIVCLKALPSRSASWFLCCSMLKAAI